LRPSLKAHLSTSYYIEHELNEKFLKNFKGECEDTLKYPVSDRIFDCWIVILRIPQKEHRFQELSR
jgi:hypothetical protein